MPANPVLDALALAEQVLTRRAQDTQYEIDELHEESPRPGRESTSNTVTMYEKSPPANGEGPSSRHENNEESPSGWSDRLGRATLEPVPDQPGCWQEPAASAALCIWCPARLAEGDRLGCEAHRRPLGVTNLGVEPAVAVTEHPVLSRNDLLALAERRGWEALAYKPGESAGGTETMWRTFAETARGTHLDLALVAVWDRWPETVAAWLAELSDAGITEGTA